MGRAAYDGIADDYATFVAAGLADAMSVLRLATDALLAQMGDVRGMTVCDLGCGEGHLSRRLVAIGATVVGVDVSASLLVLAQARAEGSAARFVRDDAQQLASLGDERFDVVCNLALMDIPNLTAVYAAVGRVLRAGGRFVLSITHPCFQGPGADNEVDGRGAFAARRIPRYAWEGFWRSTNRDGIRGRVGAHHRTLATYVNRLVAAGFVIETLVEPTLAAGADDDPPARSRGEVPSVLIVEARRT